MNTPPALAGGVFIVAPYKFLHPVYVVRRYLDNIGTVTEAEFGVGRIRTVDSTKQVGGQYPEIPAPVPAYDPTLVQPPQGAGPKFLSGSINDSH